MISILVFLSATNDFIEPKNKSVKILEPSLHRNEFPCSKCHSTYKTNFQPEKAKQHATMNFKHMQDVMTCQLCHSSSHPNELNLMDGTLIPYSEMYQICGQCHGKIAFEWERGLHGKMAGGWKENRVRWICGNCHDPHAPKFRAMESVPGPKLSPFVIRNGE